MKSLGTFTLLSLFSLPLFAQEVPAPPPAPTPVVVATQEPEKKPEVKADVAVNALINTGNSESQNVGGAAKASRKWSKNKLEGTALGSYGRAKDATTGTTSTNTKNWTARGRYDRYLTDPISLFGLGHIGQDSPAGFDWRYGGAGGYAHELVRTDPNFFKYEIGFDVTHEERVTPPDDTIYSARLFFKYKYQISANSEVGEDLETLFNVEQGEDVRINSLTGLRVKMNDVLALTAGFLLRFDNVPVPTFQKLDTTTQFGLTVTLM